MPSKRGNAFWKRLAQWYGARLFEHYGSSIPSEWAEVIDRHSDEQIDGAIQSVTRSNIKHPPTLAEFVDALPAKRSRDDLGPSIQELLCKYVIANFSPCIHQMARPWHYFGPVEEFVSKHRNKETIRHPSIEGVVVPACEKCGRPSMRSKSADVSTAVAA